MKKQLNQLSVMFFLAVFVITISAFNLFSEIFANWRECLSAPGCSCTAQSVSSSLKTYIVESAGFFLRSHSTYQIFLNRVEMSEINGTDCTEMKDILYNAIETMEKAKAAYINFKTASEKVPNDQAMIDQLLKFDYDCFQAKYGLIAPIFEKVKMLLGKGDITGLDAAILSDMDTILNQLYEVKTFVDKNQSPDIFILWRLNQSFAEAQLFGQYVSEVLKTILG